MTKTSEFARALENAIDELKEKGYADDDVILDCEGNEITQNEIVCSLLAEQVVEALEKQIPKKLTSQIVKGGKRLIGNGWWCNGTTIYRCPNCNEWINLNFDYCIKCGQALDWSDTK